MLGGGAGGGPRPEPRRLTATCWPVRVLGLNEPFTQRALSGRFRPHAAVLRTCRSCSTHDAAPQSTSRGPGAQRTPVAHLHPCTQEARQWPRGHGRP
eukprot:521472-Prymnesium_polylepis.1